MTDSCEIPLLINYENLQFLQHYFEKHDLSIQFPSKLLKSYFGAERSLGAQKYPVS